MFDARLERELWPGERVLWSQGPDPQGEMAARLSYASRKAHEAMLDSLSMSNIAGVVLSPIVAALGWLRHVWQRDISYAVTTRRLITFHGAEFNWTVLSHHLEPIIIWRKGQVGSLLFPYESDRKLDMRFDGIHSPDAVRELALNAKTMAGEE